jgi:hypothetical protein
LRLPATALELSGAPFDIDNVENGVVTLYCLLTTTIFPVATEEDHDAQSTRPLTGVGHDGGSPDAAATSRQCDTDDPSGVKRAHCSNKGVFNDFS